MIWWYFLEQPFDDKVMEIYISIIKFRWLGINSEKITTKKTQEKLEASLDKYDIQTMIKGNLAFLSERSYITEHPQ